MDRMKSAESVFGCMKCLHKFSVIKDLNDLSQGEMAVLEYLSFDRAGASAGELTDAFGVGTSRTAAILNTLERKGLAVRRPDARDGRKVLVYITDAGRREAEEKRLLAIEHMAEFLDLLGEADTWEFMRIVRKAAERQAQKHVK